jgi:hypothetical protein
MPIPSAGSIEHRDESGWVSTATGPADNVHRAAVADPFLEEEHAAREIESERHATSPHRDA